MSVVGDPRTGPARLCLQLEAKGRTSGDEDRLNFVRYDVILRQNEEKARVPNGRSVQQRGKTSSSRNQCCFSGKRRCWFRFKSQLA